MSVGMDPGLLREQVEILEAREIDDGQGGRKVSWVTIAGGVDWARIRPAPARSRAKGGKPGSPAPFEVTLRYRTDVTTTHRLKWIDRDRELAITSDPVNLDEHFEFVVFEAAEDRPR